MDSERAQELIMAQTCGELTPEEERQLAEYLFAHPEARDYQREAARVKELLSGWKDVSIPLAGEDILQQLRHPAPTPLPHPQPNGHVWRRAMGMAASIVALLLVWGQGLSVQMGGYGVAVGGEYGIQVGQVHSLDAQIDERVQTLVARNVEQQMQPVVKGLDQYLTQYTDAFRNYQGWVNTQLTDMHNVYDSRLQRLEDRNIYLPQAPDGGNLRNVNMLQQDFRLR